MSKTVLTVSLHYILTEKVVTLVLCICRLFKILKDSTFFYFIILLATPVKLGHSLVVDGVCCLIESSTMLKNCILSK